MTKAPFTSPWRPQFARPYAPGIHRASDAGVGCVDFAQYLLPEHWQVGLAPNILVNWKAEGNNSLTLPIGFGIGKLSMFGKLPGTFILEGDYSVVKPEGFG